MIHICPRSTPVCRAESSHALEDLRRQLEARLVCPMSIPPPPCVRHMYYPALFATFPRGQTADNNCQTVFGRSRDNDDGDGREHAGWLVGFRMRQTLCVGDWHKSQGRPCRCCCMIWSFHLYGRDSFLRAAPFQISLLGSDGRLRPCFCPSSEAT